MPPRALLDRFARGALSGALIAAGSALCALGAITSLLAFRFATTASTLLAATVLGLLPVTLGLVVVLAGHAASRRERMRALAGALDRRLLAAARGGATSREIARRVPLLTAQSARRRLDELARDGRLDVAVTDDGEFVYHEPSPKSERRRRQWL